MKQHKPKNPFTQRFIVLWDPPKDPLAKEPQQTKVWTGRRMRFMQAVKQVERLQRSPRTKGTFTIGEVGA